MDRLFTNSEYRKFKESANGLKLCQAARKKLTMALGGRFSLAPEHDKAFIRSYYLDIDKGNVWTELT